MYIKAVGTDDPPQTRQVWMVEATEYRRHKQFPKSYKDLQERLQEYGEYQTPLRVPCLEEIYDWEDREYTGVLWITVRQTDGEWFHALLSEATVFIMNEAGDSIDRINI